MVFAFRTFTLYYHKYFGIDSFTILTFFVLFYNLFLKNNWYKITGN